MQIFSLANFNFDFIAKFDFGIWLRKISIQHMIPSNMRQPLITIFFCSYFSPFGKYFPIWGKASRAPVLQCKTGSPPGQWYESTKKGRCASPFSATEGQAYPSLPCRPAANQAQYGTPLRSYSSASL